MSDAPAPPAEVPQMLDARALGARLGLPVAFIRQLARTGRLPSRRVGTRLIFEESAIARWLAGLPSGADSIPKQRRGGAS